MMDKPTTISDIEQSERPFNPEDIAKDPYSYVFKHKLHEDPDFDDVTVKMIEELLTHDPINFFGFGLDKLPKFARYVDFAAKQAIQSNPLYCLFVYHFDDRYPRHAGLMFEAISKALNIRTGEEFKKDHPELFDRMLKLVELISKTDPVYYVNSGLAEDEEFCRFFHNVGRKAYVLIVLKKLAEQRTIPILKTAIELLEG